MLVAKVSDSMPARLPAPLSQPHDDDDNDDDDAVSLVSLEDEVSFRSLTDLGVDEACETRGGSQNCLWRVRLEVY